MSYQDKNQFKKNYSSNIKKRRRDLKKDYQTKKLDNPFFNRKAKREKKISKRLKFISIFLFVLFIALFWLFLYSSLFTIKNIKVEGLTRMSGDSISNLAFEQSENWRLFVFKQKNIFIFSTDKLKEKIQADYNFNQIEISKKIPNTLVIKINERSCALILENSDGLCKFIDLDGYLIKELAVQDADREKLPLVIDERGVLIDDNKIDLDRNYLDFMLELNELIGKSDLKIDKFIVDKNPDTLRVTLKEGPFLMFSIKEDMEKQLNKLMILRNEKLKDTFKEIKYFDLRFGDKVFYVNNNNTEEGN